MANIRPSPLDISGLRSYIRHIDLEPILYILYIYNIFKFISMSIYYVFFLNSLTFDKRFEDIRTDSHIRQVHQVRVRGR